MGSEMGSVVISNWATGHRKSSQGFDESQRSHLLLSHGIASLKAYIASYTVNRTCVFFKNQVNASYFHTPNLVELCQAYSFPFSFDDSFEEVQHATRKQCAKWSTHNVMIIPDYQACTIHFVRIEDNNHKHVIICTYDSMSTYVYMTFSDYVLF